MEIKEGILSQYNASLAMLEESIRACPEDLWYEESGGNHILFYANLYSNESIDNYKGWYKEKENYHFMKWTPYPPNKPAEITDNFSREEILEYLEFVQTSIRRNIESMDLSKQSAFEWLPISNLELQLYNIRHIQHHVGQLIYKLSNISIKVDWIGRK